jgi:RNA recognition motif-containing protein
MYKAAKEKMKFFDFEGKPVRCLPFDISLKGENKHKIHEQNVFYKFPKDSDPSTFTYEFLHQKFKDFGVIKSIKIALNPDHSKKGYAFICFVNKEDAKKCTESLSQSEIVLRFEVKEGREVGKRLGNNLYFKNVPKDMPEDQIRNMFKEFGTIKEMKIVK